MQRLLQPDGVVEHDEAPQSTDDVWCMRTLQGSPGSVALLGPDTFAPPCFDLVRVAPDAMYLLRRTADGSVTCIARQFVFDVAVAAVALPARGVAAGPHAPATLLVLSESRVVSFVALAERATAAGPKYSFVNVDRFVLGQAAGFTRAYTMLQVDANGWVAVCASPQASLVFLAFQTETVPFVTASRTLRMNNCVIWVS